MKDYQWKKINKPAACTEAPWERFIPKAIRADTMLKIKQECIDIYGYDFKECPKRKICASKSCMGRPLPWKSPTAMPYLEQLALSATLIDNELHIETNCTMCPLFNKCNDPCAQINDFISRDKAPELKEVRLYFNLSENTKVDNVDSGTIIPFPTNFKIPWDCLTDRRQKVVRTYLYDQKDFLHTARITGLYNQAQAKYEFYAALTRLSKFAALRKFMEENKASLTDRQTFILNGVFYAKQTYAKLAAVLGITTQAVHQVVAKTVLENNLNWYVFVRRQKGKLIYNVPQILK